MLWSEFKIKHCIRRIDLRGFFNQTKAEDLAAKLAVGIHLNFHGELKAIGPVFVTLCQYLDPKEPYEKIHSVLEKLCILLVRKQPLAENTRALTQKERNRVVQQAPVILQPLMKALLNQEISSVMGITVLHVCLFAHTSYSFSNLSMKVGADIVVNLGDEMCLSFPICPKESLSRLMQWDGQGEKQMGPLIQEYLGNKTLVKDTESAKCLNILPSFIKTSELLLETKPWFLRYLGAKICCLANCSTRDLHSQFCLI